MSIRIVTPDSCTAASFSNFLKLEPYIAMILSEFPRTVEIRPKDLKASSFLVYLRTAMQAFVHEDCRWPASFTKEKVISAFEAGLKLSFDRGRNIVIAQCINIESKVRIDTASVHISDAIDGTNSEVVLAIALLKDREVLRDPVTLTNLTPELASRITSTFANITLSSDPATPSITTMF